ncbi:FliH/SctL family protein [Clostridiaceae bacterium 35-E11]
MSRILKSSYIKVDAVKKVMIENSAVDTKTDDVIHEDYDKKEIEEAVYEELYKKKMLEIEMIMKDKIDEAQAQAQRIIEDANEKAQNIYEDAQKNGFAKGRSEGYGAGKKEADKLIKDALKVKNEILSNKSHMVMDLEKECIELVIDTVEKILNNKIQDSYETIVGLVKLALDKCTYTESLVVRVSLDDYKAAVKAKDKILCLAENVDDITIKQDGSLKKGSCIVDTISGSIDSSVGTQLDQVKLLFKGVLESE